MKKKKSGFNRFIPELNNIWQILWISKVETEIFKTHETREHFSLWNKISNTSKIKRFSWLK
ncbi:MAG: hypothetical protein ACOC3S_01275 [Bacteroidota bacterium]